MAELHRQRVLEVTPDVVGSIADRAVDLDGRHAHVDGVRVDEREVDDILDGLAEQLHRDVDVADDVEPGCVVPLVPRDVEQLDLPLDREHRRAQLVLRGIEEVTLELVQLGEPSHGFAFLFEGPGVLDCHCGVVGERGERAFVAVGNRSIRRHQQHTGECFLIEHRHRDRSATSGLQTDAVPGGKLVHRQLVGHVGNLRSTAAHPQDLVATLRVHRRARRSACDRVGGAEHGVLQLLDAARGHRQRA